MPRMFSCCALPNVLRPTNGHFDVRPSRDEDSKSIRSAILALLMNGIRFDLS